MAEGTGGPAARVLDLTRLVSRAGRGAATGIDRVELAYLQQLLTRPEPLFALARTASGFVLLDRAGAAAVAARVTGATPWGRADVLGRIARRNAPARARAEADLRRHALGRALPFALPRLLARHLPAGTAYLNVGHSNLSARVFDAIHRLPGGRAAVMVHDTIPLDFPAFAGAGIPARFEQRLRHVAAGADLVIYNSHQSRADAERHFTRFGRVPAGIVSHLGVDVPVPDMQALPRGLDLTRPWFVTLGTIEPRKNHALLLDLWEMMVKRLSADDVPQLFIVGARGWAGPDLLRRLDASPVMGRHVHELGALSDGAAAALLNGAAALLFPSHAEGYGLPPIEAAAQGVPVVCGDLAIYRETLGDYPVYADVGDLYLWYEKVTELAVEVGRAGETKGKRGDIPLFATWADHFKPVLRLT